MTKFIVNEQEFKIMDFEKARISAYNECNKKGFSFINFETPEGLIINFAECYKLKNGTIRYQSNKQYDLLGYTSWSLQADGSLKSFINEGN